MPPRLAASAVFPPFRAGASLEWKPVRGLTLPLVLLAALTFLVGLGRGPITDADEAFYAEAAREMVESGDWVTPFYNYEPRFQKPILYYWLTAATYLATGPTEWAARLWSALSGVGLVLLTAACARRWYDDGVGLLAGAIVATSFGYYSIGHMALPDLLLTFFITAAIWTALVAMLDAPRARSRWVALAALAVAAGFLTKGPVGVVIPGLVVLPIVLLERRGLNLRLSDAGLALLIFVVVAFPWYGAMWSRHGSVYFESFFLGDNVERFATDRFNDPRAWWFYGPVLLGGLLPWTPIALVWLEPRMAVPHPPAGPRDNGAPAPALGPAPAGLLLNFRGQAAALHPACPAAAGHPARAVGAGAHPGLAIPGRRAGARAPCPPDCRGRARGRRSPGPAGPGDVARAAAAAERRPDADDRGADW